MFCLIVPDMKQAGQKIKKSIVYPISEHTVPKYKEVMLKTLFVVQVVTEEGWLKMTYLGISEVFNTKSEESAVM